MKTKSHWAPSAMIWLALAIGCGEGSGTFERPDDPVATPDASGAPEVPDAVPEAEVAIVPVGPPMTGLHVVGNRIQNGDGLDVVLHGVNRSGTEYRCVQNGVFFDGPSDAASIAAMATWKINAVRVPLNETCWLGINGVAPEYAGDNYKQAIVNYVQILHAFNIVPILDLHWVGPNNSAAERLQPLPDDQAPAFWTDVATTFKDDDGVIFELFNEPFPDSNRDSDVAWQCWRDGCECRQSEAAATYQAVGMQALVDAVRATGSGNLLLLGGVQYSNALSQWLTYKPSDSLDNLGAVWHVYNNNSCRDVSCWDTAPAAVAAQFPIVATEIGENDCGGSFITSLMTWLDAHRSGYLAWTWDVWGECEPFVSYSQPGHPWSLITDYARGTPSGTSGSYAWTYHDHLAGL